MSKYILCDHWQAPPPDWKVLKEEDQDITKRFQWEDNTVDRLFSEHGLEHVPLQGGINYFKESFRVLKKGGILRTVCPAIDQLIKFRDGSELSRNYTKTALKQYYQSEFKALDEMGIDPLNHGQSFLFDSLLKKHNHMHVWTSQLMVVVAYKVGFSVVMRTEPGKSNLDASTCLERVIRGIDCEDLDEEIQSYDCESVVIECKK